LCNAMGDTKRALAVGRCRFAIAFGLLHLLKPHVGRVEALIVRNAKKGLCGDATRDLDS
jgi:hypothetical protein